jgi:hypothetical protein
MPPPTRMETKCDRICDPMRPNPDATKCNKMRRNLAGPGTILGHSLDRGGRCRPRRSCRDRLEAGPRFASVDLAATLCRRRSLLIVDVNQPKSRGTGAEIAARRMVQLITPCKRDHPMHGRRSLGRVSSGTSLWWRPVVHSGRRHPQPSAASVSLVSVRLMSAGCAASTDRNAGPPVGHPTPMRISHANSALAAVRGSARPIDLCHLLAIAPLSFALTQLPLVSDATYPCSPPSCTR